MARVYGFERETDLAIKATTDATGAAYSNGYLRSPAGLLVCTTDATGATFRQGFLRAPNGALVTVDAAPSIIVHGLGRAANLALCTTTSSAGVGWINGWRVSTDRRVYMTGLSSAFVSAILADSPWGFWTLGATNGLTDQSGNGRNLSAAGGAVVGNDAANPGTQSGGSTNLDGTDDRFDAPASPYVNAATQSFEGVAWRDLNTANHTLIGGVGGAGNGPLLRLTSGSNDVIFQTVAGAGGITWAAAWPGTAQWVHWGLTFREAADTVTLYINGAPISTLADVEAYGTPGNLQIGITTNTLQPFDGKQAYVAAYPAELSAARFAAHFAAL